MQTNIKIITFASILLLSACSKNPMLEETENDSAISQPATVTSADNSTVSQPAPLLAERKLDEAMYAGTPAKAKIMMQPQPQFSTAYVADALRVDREKYPDAEVNGIKQVSQEPVSTFSIDVDTASYSNVRRMLNQGYLPQADAVRVEEMVNYFSYDYPEPENRPFSIYQEVGPSPFNADRKLLHIGIQGKKMAAAERPPANLVFLIDVSGSMQSPNKIGLLKNAFKLLTRQLTAADSVAIVVYAGAAGTVLEPTSGQDKNAIMDALERLQAGGSTNGGAGIQAAYRFAGQHVNRSGINRVILATDGDFNVGAVNQDALKNLIESERKTGIELSILGFGAGNYNDALMQELAQNGNGNAYYIDTLNEARKVLVEELSATLVTIAKDVKIQIEFNPALVSEYRLLGYETRALKREDFNNDKVDAGEIGAGHTVTAIYELALRNSNNKAVDPLRYQPADDKRSANPSELAFLRLRYKAPQGDTSELIEMPVPLASMKKQLRDTSNSYRFSAAVAGFAELLRGGNYLSTMGFTDVLQLAQQSKGEDAGGYRGEFIQLVNLARALAPQQAATNE